MIAQSEIKIDVLHIAQALSLSLSGRGGEHVGPCPNCGGDDRFHVKGKRWWCRESAGHCGKSGDVTDLVMLVENLPYLKATERVRELANLPVPDSVSTVKPIKKPVEPSVDWRSAEWQVEAGAEVAECQAKLLSSKIGLNYLYGRGFTDETIKACALGYVSEAWYSNQHAFLPAIVIPWHDGDLITCVRKRFLRPPEKEKYRLGKYCPKSRDGSAGEAILFRTPFRNSKTLVIVEGEFNGASIYQASLFDAVSSGSNSFTRKTLDALAATASIYKRVLIWFDDAKTIDKVRNAINHSSVTLYQSPVIDGQKFDANALLQADMLGGLLADLMPELPPETSAALPSVVALTPPAPTMRMATEFEVIARRLPLDEALAMKEQLNETMPGHRVAHDDDFPRGIQVFMVIKR